LIGHEPHEKHERFGVDLLRAGRVDLFVFFVWFVAKEGGFAAGLGVTERPTLAINRAFRPGSVPAG
jgi:hypothetical protein